MAGFGGLASGASMSLSMTLVGQARGSEQTESSDGVAPRHPIDRVSESAECKVSGLLTGYLEKRNIEARM